MAEPRPAGFSPVRPPSRKRELIGMVGIFACVVWFYSYIGVPPQYALRFNRQSGDYYNLLTEGFMAGRLGFKVEPPAALVGLADPYDPVQRNAAGNVGFHDATYYKGRYYLYFGVAPALVLFLPFRILTGLYFPQNLATVLFCSGGYLCSLGFFLALRRRYFPWCPTGMVWAGALMLGLGNLCAPMLARNSVWEVPISSAYFFSMLGLWLLFQGLGREFRRDRWLCGASTAFGLAVASRPHFIFLGIVLSGFWLWHLRLRVRRGERLSPRPLLREMTVFFLPFSLIVVGLLVYNYLRFDSPFEFGQKYQLSGNPQLHAQLVAAKFFPINFYYYVLAPAQWERYFPFIQVIRGYPGVRPADYMGAEDPYGVWANMPFAWLALLAPLLWWRIYRRERDLGAWLRVLVVAFLVMAGATMCFAWAANRYMLDFLPLLLLIAAVGLLMAADRGADSRAVRWFWRGGSMALIAATAIFNILVAFQHNDKFRAGRADTFAWLANWFDRPALWLEGRLGQAYGPAELTVRFPLDRAGKAEPLMVSGVSYKSDYIYVYYYPDLRRIQLAFTLTNRTHVLSQPINVDYRVPHRIGIVSGALYPSPTHPFFSGWPAAEVEKARRSLTVTLDGVPYLTTEAEFFETSPGFVTFGENHVSDYIEPKFTGEILGLRRGSLPPPITAFVGGGFLRLGLVFPPPTGLRDEAIVTTGKRGADDRLFVEYPSAETLRFGLQHAGSEPVLSPPVSIVPGSVQLLEASLGSFYPSPRNARERELAHMLVLRLNGEIVWRRPFSFYPPDEGPPVIGRSAPGMEKAVTDFSGRIVAQQTAQILPAAPDSPFQLPPYWLETGAQPGYGAIRLHLELPRPWPTRPEPLLVTGGKPGQADYVTIEYPQAGRILLNYTHTGSVAARSAGVVVDESRPQVVEIDVPSLYPTETDAFFATRSLVEIAALRRSHVRLAWNGRLLMDTPTAAYAATAAQISIGEDHLIQVFGPRFTGHILAIERATLSPPPGLAENSGPLELTFVFPEQPAPGTETLLATGDGNAWDCLLLEYDQNRHARLLVRSAHGSSFASPAMAIDSLPHQLRLGWGGLSPGSGASTPGAATERRERQLAVEASVDGKTLIKEKMEFVRASPQTVILGGATPDGSAFSGRLQSVQRLP
jgi:hypothetical protein